MYLDGASGGHNYIPDVYVIGFFAWLFNKKPCPKCGGKVKRKREVKLVKKSKNKGWAKTPAEYSISHGFICESCGRKFTFWQVRHPEWKSS